MQAQVVLNAGGVRNKREKKQQDKEEQKQEYLEKQSQISGLTKG
jgi:hypothetical protein